MQDELLQFRLQKVWRLVDLPKGKQPIRTKWVYRNKKDKRGIVVRNKARLVAQGYTQEEGIDYDEVFTLVAKIEAIRLFLAYASFMGFIVYQMDVKSTFLYGIIKEEVYVWQAPGFEDLHFPNKVYKVINRTMSSPNHPTSNIEDAFSSNFLDNTTASLNYFSASPGNISHDPLDNLSKYLFASLAISPFHNVQAYNVVANKPPILPQDPITPPTILTPSPVLPPSPLLDP
nr:copia protein [Tanacetum cinerariifolium]